MPIFHCEMKFASSPYGWTEALYRMEATPKAALNAIIELAQARYSILGAGASLYRVRVSQVGFARASVTTLISGKTQSQLAYNGLEAAQIELSAGSGGLYRREYWLRGLPFGSLTNASGRWQFSGSWAGPIQAWLAKLMSGKWLLQAWGRAGPRFPIQGIFDFPLSPPDGTIPGPPDVALFVPPNTVNAVVTGLPMMPPPDPTTNASPSVRISGVKWSVPIAPNDPQVNGEFMPVAVQLNNLQYWGGLPSLGDYVSGGYLQLRPRLYPSINSWRLVKFGVHKTGPAPKESMQSTPVPSQEQQLADIGGLLASNLQTTPQGLAKQLGVLTQVEPPPPAPPPPIPPVPPLSGILGNAQEVLIYIQDNLNLDVPGPEYKPIGIAPVVNYKNTWWIGCSGTFAGGEDTDTGVLAAIRLGCALMTDFTNGLRDAILATVPKGATLLFAGLSQGGMVCEYISYWASSQYTVWNVVTFGSPKVTCGGARTWDINRLMVTTDWVPFMGPIAILNALLLYPDYFPVKPDPNFPLFPKCHTQMFRNPAFSGLDFLGGEGGGFLRPLQLGPLTTFHV